MTDNWIPVRERLPETEDWVLVQTQDGTVYPASYIKNTWSPLFRGGLVEQLMHGKVAYWQEHAVGYPYVQCACGSFYLQAEGRKECPICASFHQPKEVKKETPKRASKGKETPVKPEEVPFSDLPTEDDILGLIEE